MYPVSTSHWLHKNEKALSLHCGSFETVKHIPDIPIWNTEKVLPYEHCFKGRLRAIGVETWLQSQIVPDLNLCSHLQAITLGKLFNL